MDEIKHWLAVNMLVGAERTNSNRLIKAFGFPENVFAAIIATCFSGKDVQAWYNETTIKKDRFSGYYF